MTKSTVLYFARKSSNRYALSNATIKVFILYSFCNTLSILLPLLMHSKRSAFRTLEPKAQKLTLF